MIKKTNNIVIDKKYKSRIYLQINKRRLVVKDA